MKIESEVITIDKQLVLENGSIINRFCHILPGAEIGTEVMIGQGCFVGSDTKIGDRTRIQNGNNIWNGVELGEDVFIGPVVAFTNHRDPSDRFKRDRKDFVVDRTIVKDKATICTNVTIIAPCIIGESSRVAAGSIVLRNVKANEYVRGVVKHERTGAVA